MFGFSPFAEEKSESSFEPLLLLPTVSQKDKDCEFARLKAAPPLAISTRATYSPSSFRPPQTASNTYLKEVRLLPSVSPHFQLPVQPRRPPSSTAQHCSGRLARAVALSRCWWSDPKPAESAGHTGLGTITGRVAAIPPSVFIPFSTDWLNLCSLYALLAPPRTPSEQFRSCNICFRPSTVTLFLIQRPEMFSFYLCSHTPQLLVHR